MILGRFTWKWLETLARLSVLRPWRIGETRACGRWRVLGSTGLQEALEDRVSWW